MTRLYAYGAAVIALLAGVWLYGHFRYEAGEASVQAEWNEERLKTQKELIEANQVALEKERAATKAVSDLQNRHNLEIKALNDKNKSLVASYRAGDQRLRYLATPNPPKLSQGPSTPSGSDAGTPTELPREIAGNLFALTGEADEVVLQLKLAQDTIKAYYETCK